MFDLNAYLMDDSNLKMEWLRMLKTSRQIPQNVSETASLLENKFSGLVSRQVRPIRCADGLEFSAQASIFHYSIPRNNEGPWTAVEIGYPNQRVDEFMEYAEDPENPTETVYGGVPVNVVEAVVEKHGGIL